MSKALTSTIMSVVFAGMGLFGDTRVAQAEEVGNSKFRLLDSPQTEYVVDFTKTIQETYVELARILDENTDKDTYHQMDYAMQMFDFQFVLPNVVRKFMNVNADKVDFSRHSKFCIKCYVEDEHGISHYVYFDDASKLFARLSRNGVMVKTSKDPKKVFFECNGDIIRIDTERHLFSMIWIDDFGVKTTTTVSPALNYDAPKKWRKKVTNTGVRSFVEYIGISVPELNQEPSAL